MKFSSLKAELAGLTFVSAIVHFWNLSQPQSVVFDEVYFKVFAGHYLDHRYFFDIHPPLVKLLLAGWASLLHLPIANLISTTDPSVALRALPALAGTLLVPLFWVLLRQLGARRPFAFLGALAVLCDNALLVESRLILMDSLLLLFGVACVSAYLKYRQALKHRWLWLVLSALAGGAAASTKWTGLTALGVVGLLWLRDSYHSYRQQRLNVAHRLAGLVVLVVIPLAVYMGAFAAHFALLSHSGDGDAFMSVRFQSTLVGSAYYNPATHMSFLDKFVELNREMYVANQTLTATHPYGSRWYTWPLELRPIYYWEGTADANGNQGNIYLLGNPIVWWGTALAVVAGLGVVWYRRIHLRPATVGTLIFTGVAYLANYLPFVGVTRVMFLYHYFFAFLFSIAFAILLWNDLATSRHDNKQLESRRASLAFMAVAVAIVLGFAWFAPISYGLKLSAAGLQSRMWLTSWR